MYRTCNRLRRPCRLAPSTSRRVHVRCWEVGATPDHAAASSVLEPIHRACSSLDDAVLPLGLRSSNLDREVKPRFRLPVQQSL